MKYIDEFRDGDLARNIARSIAAEADPAREYRFMEFCGGHTHAISRYGLSDLLPPNVRMIHGPGCPVCVLPIGRVDQAIRMALEHEVILCTYGDCLRVPASDGLSLLKAKARGADVRMVYSTQDALALAQKHPERQVVFFAIGFETTTPPTAVAIDQAAALGLGNFSVLCCHVLTPAAIVGILESPEAKAGGVALDGMVGPAHVSTVIGSAPYEFVPERYGKPVVIAGFEPLDMMQAILMLVRQVNQGRAKVENEFTRAVTPEGNRKAQALVAKIFELRPEFEWRGLGTVPDSALKLRPEYAAFDAELRFPLPYTPVPDHKACECGAILRGVKEPRDCKVFGTVCTPENPLGSCMVSSEGACAAHYTYGRYKDAVSS
ncbi:hydrogenase formation protein HypD [Azovibrio restrictus]|uniref:hydrogenase formation protein HypD n=1 Tax=Azovibrio restrictus TaxID=146938 RepID=UPI0026F2EA94|nr:hydrogenase formation protein HypD [Azovibrio restrictus]MDD3481641.1 hydrogenase formation protein HypD [Azovibrio restrictus]